MQHFKILILLEEYVRKPLSDTIFDRWIATPVKQLYIRTVHND